MTQVGVIWSEILAESEMFALPWRQEWVVG
jgi:hypothetical protein